MIGIDYEMNIVFCLIPIPNFTCDLEIAWLGLACEAFKLL